MAQLDMSIDTCPQCGSQMRPEHYHAFEVRVYVCTKPTCLHRIYPDYPKRKSNQATCYLCETIFTFGQDDLGVLCPACKARVNQYKKKTAGKHQRTPRSQTSRNVLYL